MSTSPRYAFLEAVFSSQRLRFPVQGKFSYAKTLPPGIWTFQSTWFISAKMRITANATLSPNATSRRHQWTHTGSPFHFSNRETGLEGAITCAKRSEIKDFKITFGLLSCFYNSCQVIWQREKICFWISISCSSLPASGYLTASITVGVAWFTGMFLGRPYLIWASLK